MTSLVAWASRVAFSAPQRGAPSQSAVRRDLDAHYSGVLAPKTVRGRFELTARDLSRFAPLVGTALKGEARARESPKGDIKCRQRIGRHEDG